MRSWVFRNRARLEALLGRPSVAVQESRRVRRPSAAPRVVVLVPARRS